MTYRRFGWKAISIKPLWGFAIVALLPFVLYVHALRIPTAILAIGEKPHFFGEQGVGFVNAKQVLVIVKRNFWPYLTPLVVVPSIAGIFLFGTTSRFGKLFHYWLIAMAIVHFIRW